MPTSFTASQIQHLKLQAKITARTSGVPRSAALDAIANLHGFSNWSLLMKHTALPAPYIQPQKYFRFQRSSQGMQTSFKKVENIIGRFDARYEEAERQAFDIWDQFGSACNAIDFAVDFMTCALSVPRFRVHSAAPVYWEMRNWLPYDLSELSEGTQILVNRGYKPVGKGGDAFVNYVGFDNLVTRLSERELSAIAYDPEHAGALYNDGTAPWLSRRSTESYLVRLRNLQSILRR